MLYFVTLRFGQMRNRNGYTAIAYVYRSHFRLQSGATDGILSRGKTDFDLVIKAQNARDAKKLALQLLERSNFLQRL